MRPQALRAALRMLPSRGDAHLVAARRQDLLAREESRRQIRAGVYGPEAGAVLTYKQRDCVVQYVCEVRVWPNPPNAAASLCLLPGPCATAHVAGCRTG